MTMDMQPEVANCRSCEAPIIWARTRSGKNMPLDAKPSLAGAFYITLATDGVWECHHRSNYDGELPEDVNLHWSHFSTCPNASWHRKGE